MKRKIFNRKTISVILPLLVLLGVIVYLNWGTISLDYILPAMIRPTTPFDASSMQPLDYSDMQNWAARPEIEDDFYTLPDGVTKQDTDIAVFFVHPSSLVLERFWNLDIERERIDSDVNEDFLAGQASAFAPVADVYMPYYRQASLYAVIYQSGSDGDLAMGAAYSDVADAFDHFVTTEIGDRPFVVASHSQGSLHSIRLLAEKVYGTPLEKQLVAAYLVGVRVNANIFTACTEVDEYGCVLSWNAFTEGADIPDAFLTTPIYQEGKYSREPFEPIICNPPVPNTNTGYTAYLPTTGLRSYVDAGECEEGYWFIEEPEDPVLHEIELTPGWLHAYEYSYPWVAIGHDVMNRYENWKSIEQ